MLEQAAALYLSGVRLAQVANEFDVDRRYLSKVLRDTGFMIRNPGRQKRT